ncbi:MAG: 50S ribosomal protein L11 methyltransferase [Betaproteobacteria bacterium]
MSQLSFDEFLDAHTRIAAPPICPEISLHLGNEIDAIWEKQESCLACFGTAPPYWAMAWVGGQALARYTLDHPSLFAHRSFLDFGSGSGLCAIAAAKVGATVAASDIDPYSIQAITSNARLNNVNVETLQADLIGAPSRWSIVVAGDLWYESTLARRLTSWLRDIANQGTQVLLGDCGRAHFPRHRITALQRYEIPTSEALERRSITSAAVWRLGA